MNWTRAHPNAAWISSGDYTIARAYVAGKARYTAFKGHLKYGVANALEVMKSFDSADEAKAYLETLHV